MLKPKAMQGARSIPSSDMPLLSRLDRLDFIVSAKRSRPDGYFCQHGLNARDVYVSCLTKCGVFMWNQYLVGAKLKRFEGRQNLSGWGGGPEGVQPAAVDIAAKNAAYFKGSLLDRVASLETRLFQLCMDIESSSTSGNSSSQTSSGYASSSQGSKSDPSSSSLPVFTAQHNEVKPVFHLHPNISEIQELAKIEEQGRQGSDPVKQKCEKSRDDRASKSSKKKNSKRKFSKWMHLNMLGC